MMKKKPYMSMLEEKKIKIDRLLGYLARKDGAYLGGTPNSVLLYDRT